MPPRRSMSTLARMCLQSIAENMQSLWVTDYAEKYMEEYSFMYVEGPFNQLAGPLVQELIKILGESHKLTRAGLHLLLQPHLTELSLHYCSGLINKAIIDLVTVRCKFLTSLDLHSCSRVPAGSLAILVGRLPRLMKLCLSDTQCDSLALATIGSCCQRLRELDISRCRKLSPSSLLSLVYDSKRATFSCQALKVLLLQDVKPQGDLEQWVNALCYILLALPSLEQLSNPSVLSALRLIHTGRFSHGGTFTDSFPSLAEVARRRVARKSGCNGLVNVRDSQSQKAEYEQESDTLRGKENWNGTAGISLHLRKLEDLEEEDVSSLGSLCQEVEEAAITLGIQTVSAWSLVQWPNLTQLTLHSPEQPNRMLEEMLTSLHAIGNSLRVLSLQNLLWGQEESLSTLLTWCPNLQSFQGHFTVLSQTLFHNDPELPPWARKPLPLPHLHTFNFLLEGEDSLHPTFQHQLGGFLVALLQGCLKLECLSLCGVPTSLDSVFEVVYASSPPHPLQRLSEVSLCHSNVTQWGASLLLRSKNDLSHLDLSHCKDVTCRDYHKLQEMARKEGSNISISWQ
ncbi:uncharacterized protein LOC134931802 [Pseudophryne corroboree]|uniref:uncharacterized protein LOC134931802 n=1 Tax=Pseudophryne corroboree TaxID=495146 RepID=UPI003081FC86